MNNLEILDRLLLQVKNFDSKATILLSAVGIVFGFSFLSINILESKINDGRIDIIIAGIIYLLSFLITMVSLVLIVVPRDRNRIEKRNIRDSKLYFEDIYTHIKNGDFEHFISQDVDNDIVIEQIKVNSRIAHKKYFYTKISSISIICFVVSLVVLVCLSLL